MFSLNKTLFFTNFFATLFMLVVIWWTQLYTYPSFAKVETSEFVFFHAKYSQIISFIVIVPMLVEILSSAMLIFHAPQPISSAYFVVGFVLVAIIWLSTFLLQVPMHEILGNGFDPEAHQTLVKTNWIRTITWSLRSLLVVFLYFRYLK